MWTLIILLLSLLLSMMRFITGFTCPPTIYFKFITKCDKYYYKVRQLLLLQSATAFLLQSTTSVITKYNRYYKVWQFYYKVRRLLQSATVHTVIRPSEQEKQMTHTRINQSTYVVRIVITSNPGFLFSCSLANDFNLALRMKVTATVTADQTITQAINNHRTTRNISVKKKGVNS